MVIVPPGGGYCLAHSVDEAERYMQILRDQVAALQETLTVLEETLAQRYRSFQAEMPL